MSSGQQRKALDPRIQHLITNGVLQSHRSFLVMIGSAKEQQRQIVNLHYLLSQARLSHASTAAAAASSSKAASRPTVLWTYKKELGFTSNRKKRESKVKRDIKRGIRQEGELDPFELFVGVTDIRYTYYKDTDKILGQTFGMLVLQDFEAITPNLLARTIETVEGGGLVVLLLQSLTSLKQLYTMSMDVHARYRTESSAAPVARFNERFILSLGTCSTCLVLDDELNVLPISQAKSITALEPKSVTHPASVELASLKSKLADTKLVGEIVKEARTIDQAQAILTFTDAISSKTLSSTVTLTAARGRGKSAALGLSIALAVAHSYSNIFVTSPSPENLKTLFEFLLKGFDKLGYEEHLDYDVVQSSNAEWKGAVVRVNVFREHRQTIQYIQPQDAHVLGQAELVVIDEAAAIPLPLVKNLIGPYLVFMASTVNGYEGTGRSLSLKLIQQLRELARPSASGKKTEENGVAPAKKKGSAALLAGTGSLSRSLKEIKLEEPIRYGRGDPVEKWLNTLLCLDATIVSLRDTIQGCPHPSQCDLFLVDRDTLFSFHPASELFLQRMMALYVASHYKNSPNDLQLMSDAPGHALFVLLPPLKESDTGLPEPLVVIQVALEGRISKESVLNSLGRGVKASGDLVPWTISQQFQDDEFASLSGARVVRIAVHPDYAKMGYGTHALEALDSFYSGKLLNLEEVSQSLQAESYVQASKVSKNADLHTESISIRDPAKMPPLLHRLSEIQPEPLDYLSVSYGLTPSLFKFWKRSGYIPLYIRQTTNELTGEHSCVMIKGLSSRQEETKGWLSSFAQDFQRRFLSLLSYKFSEFTSITALSVLEACNAAGISNKPPLTPQELRDTITPYDLKRLDSYANNMLDYHVILDLLPTLASLYFTHRFPADCKLTGVQSAILLAVGLQRKSVEDVESELNLAVSQLLALFVKVIRKLAKTIEDRQKAEIDSSMPAATAQQRIERQPMEQSLNDELAEEAAKVMKGLNAQEEQQSDALMDDATATNVVSLPKLKRSAEDEESQPSHADPPTKRKKAKKSKHSSAP